MKKKLFGFLLLLVCVLPLTGCLKKDPIDVEKFTSEMEGRGFTVTPATDVSSGPEGLRVAYVASKAGTNYKVELYTFDGKDSATKAFEGQKETLKSTNSSNYKEVEVNGLNYSTFNLSNTSGYYHIVRVEEKIIYAYGPADDQNDMKDIIKALGY
jgi:hypothetical protein